MPATLPATFLTLRALQHEAATLQSVKSLLNWDQETYMPGAGAAHRADQQAIMSALHHERATSRKMGDAIAACEADPAVQADAALSSCVRESRRDFDRATRLPTDLVAEFARTASQSQEAWKAARSDNDFPSFAPWLDRMMELSRRKAKCYGAGAELYDDLLDEYEPGATAVEIESIFGPLRKRLADLVGALARGKGPSESILNARIDAARQHAFGLTVLKAIGFDLSAGRLDTTTHPFCDGIGPGDTRLTTRYRDERFTDALYGTMHEAGHGMYEQGLPKGADWFGTPLSEAISLGIHESQSRMWENFVGRSRSFWEWALPIARAELGLNATVDDLYRAVNTAHPSFIRVEADEATYNLHVMVRFEIERALISGSITARDVPGLWNERYTTFLGVTPPDDRRGCLQDVHWSFGLIGYFPTYTLGNMYAAQFWEEINQAIPTLSADMARGEFGGLKAWLNTNIHAHGRRYRAGEMCQRITGKALSADPLLRHLEGKLRPIYGI